MLSTDVTDYKSILNLTNDVCTGPIERLFFASKNISETGNVRETQNHGQTNRSITSDVKTIIATVVKLSTTDLKTQLSVRVEVKWGVNREIPPCQFVFRNSRSSINPHFG